MKKTLISLLLALCLCLSCFILIACDEDEVPVDDNPVVENEEIGKKGEVTLFPKEENKVIPNQPNEQMRDETPRY